MKIKVRLFREKANCFYFKADAEIGSIDRINESTAGKIPCQLCGHCPGNCRPFANHVWQHLFQVWRRPYLRCMKCGKYAASFANCIRHITNSHDVSYSEAQKSVEDNRKLYAKEYMVTW